jgi:hypothetical protein
MHRSSHTKQVGESRNREGGFEWVGRLATECGYVAWEFDIALEKVAEFFVDVAWARSGGC